jgi:minor histocompatibility antigen H13
MANTTYSSLSARLADEAHLILPLLPTYLHLLLSAIFPIITASFASLSKPSSAAPRKRIKTDTDDLDEESDAIQKIENLSPSDALVFPVLAGGTLLGLYFLIKYLGNAELLNLILGWYFGIMGIGFVYKFLRDGILVLRSFYFPTCYSFVGHVYRVDTRKERFVALNPAEGARERMSPLPWVFDDVLPSFMARYHWEVRRFFYAKRKLAVSPPALVWKARKPIVLSVSNVDVIAGFVSLVTVGYHTVIDKPWPLTNLLGFSFCYVALQLTSPSTAWTGTLILSALFFYDIYFVFYTPVMVTVATKLDVPIKLLFPRPDGCVYPLGAEATSELMREYLVCKGKKRAMAMLGLGDIVIPGLMVGLALRFDLYIHYLRKQKTVRDEDSGKDVVKKESFITVTGAWGERFWVAKSTLKRALTTTLMPPATPNDQLPTPVPERSDAHDRILALHDSISARSFPKPYFWATVSGYTVGLITTVLAMQVSKHAQPALLYLVPGVVGGVWGCAVLRGEVGVLWGYCEDVEEEGEKDGKGEGEGKKGIEGGEGKDEKTAYEDGKEAEMKTKKASVGDEGKVQDEVEDSQDEEMVIVEAEGKKDR